MVTSKVLCTYSLYIGTVKVTQTTVDWAAHASVAAKTTIGRNINNPLGQNSSFNFLYMLI